MFGLFAFQDATSHTKAPPQQNAATTIIFGGFCRVRTLSDNTIAS